MRSDKSQTASPDNLRQVTKWVQMSTFVAQELQYWNVCPRRCRQIPSIDGFRSDNPNRFSQSAARLWTYKRVTPSTAASTYTGRSPKSWQQLSCGPSGRRHHQIERPLLRLRSDCLDNVNSRRDRNALFALILLPGVDYGQLDGVELFFVHLNALKHHANGYLHVKLRNTFC